MTHIRNATCSAPVFDLEADWRLTAVADRHRGAGRYRRGRHKLRHREILAVAGLSGMPARQLAVYNMVRGVLWGSFLMMAGFWLGKIAWVHEHLHWLSLVIVVLSVIPVAWHLSVQRNEPKESAHAGFAGRG